MPYYSQNELQQLGFKSLGKNVKVSSLAAIYNHELISIGDNSRIDDFCVISGKIDIGKHVHITPQCLIAGGSHGITLADYTTLAYQVKVFTQSDDYHGHTMTNSTIPEKYKNEIKKPTSIGKFSIIGANSIVLPGANLAVGTSVGAMSLITNPTEPWGIYVGSPAKRIRDRSKDLLELEKQFLAEHNA